MASACWSTLSLRCIRFVYNLLDLNTIKTYVFHYRYIFYALLKDAFGERVQMLYTDTDSFFLYFFVEDLAKEIISRPPLRDAFDFSEITNGHFSKFGRGKSNLHAGEVG